MLIRSPASNISRRVIRALSRRYATDSQISHIQHLFSAAEAAQIFLKDDAGRFFAPLNNKIVAEQYAVAASEGNPLKKVYLPFFGATAVVVDIHYSGRYGIDHTYYTPYIASNGHVSIQVSTETDWHSISGRLRTIAYHPEVNGMLVYAGFTWSRGLIENAMSGYPLLQQLVPFDPATVAADTFVDPFKKRAAITQGIFYERIKDDLDSRAQDDIKNRVRCDHVEVNEVSYNYKDFNLSNFLLPAYILQYENAAPRVLPAFTFAAKIEGAAPLSSLKVGTTVGIAAAFVSLLFPAVSIPVRLVWVAASMASSGVWAEYRLAIKHAWQQSRIKKEEEMNESVAESLADQQRREATEGHAGSVKQKKADDLLDVDEIYFQILDLDPTQAITEKMIAESFNKKIKQVHPDQNKKADPEETRALILARNQMYAALKKKNAFQDGGRRHFSTMRRVATAVREPPASVYHHRAAELIRTMLDEKNYKNALVLVMDGGVHPDAHDNKENTLLTEAAKRGDIEAIRFAINDLKASPDTSCDCPAHNTALHYAAGNGDHRVVELLLKLGAEPNLINTEGKTPLDVAILNKAEKTQQVLMNHGALQHSTLAGQSARSKMRGFFRYRSADRTMLLFKDNKVVTLPAEDSVIHLPAPDMKK